MYCPMPSSAGVEPAGPVGPLDCMAGGGSARGPMPRMPGLADGAEIRAPAEATFAFKGSRAIFHVEDGARHMRVETAAGAHDYRITKVIGGRTREDFVGRESDAAEELVL